MSEKDIVSFQDSSGKRHQVNIDVADYKEAAEKKISLSQLYERKYPSGIQGVSSFQQMVASSGIRLRPDKKMGIPASTMREVLEGGFTVEAGAIVRPDGSARQTTAGRLLFPEVILQTVNSALTSSQGMDYLQPFFDSIALTNNVVGPRVDQPTIKTTAPEDSESMPIDQLNEPASMVTITTGEKSFRIPTRAVSLMVSDEALESVTLDLLGITLTAQGRGEKAREMNRALSAMINGDVDTGVNATTFDNMSTFDSDIPLTYNMTQLAYISWLRANYQKMTVTHVLANTNTALKLENRNGRPTAFNQSSSQPNQINVEYSLENLGLPVPRLILVDPSVLANDKVVGYDAAYAMQSFVNVMATYSVIEEFVLRRGKAMRFDYGRMVTKMFDDAWIGGTLGA